MTTSESSGLEQLRSIRTFFTSVVDVADVHPHLRQITVGGGDLHGFTPLRADTFLYVLLPPSGRHELTIDRSFTWERWAEMAEAERPVGAYYTLRAWRPDIAEIDLLFVLHEPSGPASQWARCARFGDPVALWGPRDAFHPPAETQWYVLVADDTGLPGVAAILESLPPGVPVLVVAEVENADEQLELPSRPSIDVTWCYRHGRSAGTAPEVFADAIRPLKLPDGPGYVWGGAESRAMAAVRRHVRRERGLKREQVSLVGYWRHATSVVVTGDGDGDGDGDLVC